MTSLATGSSATVTLRDDGKCTVTTNGGDASVVETVAGVSTTHAFGPRPMRMAFGPYSEGASLVITNTSAVLDYDSPQSDVRYARDSSGNVTGLVGPDGGAVFLPGPSATFASLPDATLNAGKTYQVTDIGKSGSGSLWISNGADWIPLNGRCQLLHTAIPFVLSASGSMGNNGAVTLGVALDRVYPRCFMYFPANAIFAGSLAGWFWTVMSSTTVGTVYNNTYTSGYPGIPTIAGFTTTGPGAYTQTAGSDLAALAVTLPANCLGRWGGMLSRLCMTAGGAGGTKTGKVFVSVSQVHVTTISSANNFANALGGFNMDGATATLKTTYAEQNAGVTNGTSYNQVIFTNDMTIDKSVTVTLKTAAAATDWVVLQDAELIVVGG